MHNATMLSCTRYSSRLPLRSPCLPARLCARSFSSSLGSPGSSPLRTTKQLNDTLGEVQSGLHRVSGDHDVMQKKLHVVDKQFVVLEDKITYALQHLDDRMTTMETRLTDQMKGLDTRLTDQMKGLDTRLTDQMNGLEKRVVHRMASIKTRLSIQMNHLIWQNGIMMASLIVLLVLGGTDAGRQLLQLVIARCGGGA